MIVMDTNDDVDNRLVDEQGTLRRLGGDRQLFQDFISIFMEDSRVQLEKIREALNANDATAAETNAHSLKGLVSNFGAKECVEVALKIERAGRDGDVSNCEENFARLEKLQRQLEVELKELS